MKLSRKLYPYQNLPGEIYTKGLNLTITGRELLLYRAPLGYRSFLAKDKAKPILALIPNLIPFWFRGINPSVASFELTERETDFTFNLSLITSGGTIELSSE